VALPLDWKELRRVDPKEFTVSSASRWLRRRKDPWHDDRLARAAGL
jgi:DNA primase